MLVRAAERTVRLMRDYDASAVEDVFSEGLLNVMDAPEFSRSATLRRIFGVLHDRVYLGGLMPQLTRDGRVRVFIGTENAHIEMRDVSLVLAPYGRARSRRGCRRCRGPDAHGAIPTILDRALRQRPDE